MKGFKVILGAVVLGSLLITGCSDAKFVKTQAEVKTVSEKVDALQSDVYELQKESQVASEEAARANQRLDNQVTIYKK